MRGGAETSGGHITAGHVALGGTGPRGGVGPPLQRDRVERGHPWVPILGGPV